MDAVRCHTFFLKQADQHVFFDILQIPTKCVQICSGYIAPTSDPLVTGIPFLSAFHFLLSIFSSFTLVLVTDFLMHSVLTPPSNVEFRMDGVLPPHKQKAFMKCRRTTVCISSCIQGFQSHKFFR